KENENFSNEYRKAYAEIRKEYPAMELHGDFDYPFLTSYTFKSLQESSYYKRLTAHDRESLVDYWAGRGEWPPFLPKQERLAQRPMLSTLREIESENPVWAGKIKEVLAQFERKAELPMAKTMDEVKGQLAERKKLFAEARLGEFLKRIQEKKSQEQAEKF